MYMYILCVPEPFYLHDQNIIQLHVEHVWIKWTMVGILLYVQCPHVVRASQVNHWNQTLAVVHNLETYFVVGTVISDTGQGTATNNTQPH